MPRDQLKGGIIGCGEVTTNSHLPAWRKVKDARIVAVHDHKEEAATQTASQWNIPAAYGELSRMLGNEKLDFVP